MIFPAAAAVDGNAKASDNKKSKRLIIIEKMWRCIDLILPQTLI
jgi:hypothetical protein